MFLFRYWLTRYKKTGEIIRQFRRAGAVNFDLSQTIEKIAQINEDSRFSISYGFLNPLIRRGIIVNNGDKTFYLDERALMNRRLRMIKWGMVVFFGLLIFIVLYLYKK